jgi:16S rRNA (cytidine1402-2'-O)-methyltransferase
MSISQSCPGKSDDNMKGKLYLFPATLGESPIDESLPSHHLHYLKSTRHFIVEELRSARRFLKKAYPEIVIDDLSFSMLNEHTSSTEILQLLEPLKQGHDVILLSEAGLPCVADPGAALVALAHEAAITVIPLVGPSSIYLALMASGMNGQHFVFHGYLPIDKRERNARLKQLEADAWIKDQTQIFIETPYRNLQMLEALLQACKPETRICIAMNLTLQDEWIRSQTVEKWKKGNVPEINKKPAVFLLYC